MIFRNDEFVLEKDDAILMLEKKINQTETPNASDNRPK